MVEMTAKENWLRALHGQDHPHVPRFTLGMPGFNNYTAMRSVMPDTFQDHHNGPQGGKDIWGVSYVANEETGYASLPEPNNFILEEIDDWEKIVMPVVNSDKWDYIKDIDWEAKAKADYEKAGIDREQSAVSISGEFMPFMTLVAFMGFNNGLMALVEDPDACKDMLMTIADFYAPVVEKYVEYYKPDMLSMGDDICSKYNPFFSRAVLEDVFIPVYQRIAKIATNRGIPIHWHICGRCEDYYPDLVEKIGVRSTDPAQETSDLLAVKEKMKGGKLLLCGGFDWEPPENWPNVTEEQIKQMVRDHIDKYAPGGGYAFAGAALGRFGDKTVEQCNQWIREEVHAYGMHYYDR